jgi:hypothetical protein
MLQQSSLYSFPKVLYWDGQHEIETLAFGRSEDGRPSSAVLPEAQPDLAERVLSAMWGER